jgi:hypothetical protein
LWEVSLNPKENKVAQNEYNTVSNEIRAQDVHRLTQEVLQANWPLDMQKRLYTAGDIWDVVIAAAAERMTIEMACALLAEAPSANTVRNALHGLLADESRMAEVEQRANVMLAERLPKQLLNVKLPAAIDLTEIPYHGQHVSFNGRY